MEAVSGTAFWGLSLGNWSDIIQTTAIAITGIVAVFAIRSNAKMSRHRATIDLLLSQRTDINLSKAKKTMTRLHSDPSSSITALACKGKESDEDRHHVLTILNNYEFIALGIREKALDEDVYKRAHYSMLMRDWRATQAFITEFRTQNNTPTTFQEFEYLYKRWIKRPLKKDSQH